MNKKLEALFELASSENESVSVSLPEHTRDITETALTNLEKIDESLPLVRGLDHADAELDELAELATSSFKDLQDLGMQVESKYSSEIFSAAGTMLGHAITAKTAKINKKLKQLEIQLKKAQLDAKMTPKAEEIENTPVGKGFALDRNALLKMLSEQKTDTPE